MSEQSSLNPHNSEVQIPAHPLTKKESQLIADVYKLLPVELPGFISRQQQKDMITFAARTFANETISIIEAPTGTGKSFGYQIPGIVLALSRDKRVILSTETASLQDQIFNRDLEVLGRILHKLGMKAPAALAKGRERYVCPVRLESTANQGNLLEDDDSLRKISDISSAWNSGWDGQRDSLSFPVPSSVWKRVNNNRHICTNDRCHKADQCPHMTVKAQIKEARIIVVNHSYLLSTIAAQRGGEANNGKKNPVIDFERNYYAFDEGHHLHDRCIEAFANKSVIDDEIVYQAEQSLISLRSSKSQLFAIRAEAMRAVGNALKSNIRNIIGTSDHYRFLLGSVPPVLTSLIEEYANGVKVIADLLSDAIDDIVDKAGSSEMLRIGQQVILASAKSVHGQLCELEKSLTQFTNHGDRPQAKWIDFKGDVCTIHVAPFEAGGLAREMLWKNMKGAVVTSATIASLGEFGPTLSSLGLPRNSPTLKLSSPLDYSRARLVVPRMMVAANSPGYSMMVTAIVRQTAFHGDHLGCLFYFTSRRSMESVFNSLTKEEKDSVIMQGQLLPSAMIKEHKRRVDAGLRSLLFGLDSIAEGVDLPRSYCTLVCVDKIPFPSPQDPILASHSEHIEAQGLHPFPLLMLPRAGIKLAQVAGRLVRTEDDWGELWILDRRIVEKSYGNRLLKSTPFREIVQR